MRHMQLRLASLLTAAVLGGCLATPADDVAPTDELGTDVAEEIGVCGANQDPRTGVTCTYRIWGSYGSPAYVRASVITGADGLDYLQCEYTVTCRVTGTATSDEVTCASVIGTGCGDTTTTVRLKDSHLLPAGAPEPSPEAAAAMCEIPEPFPSMFASEACHRAQPVVVEQGEDLCCVTRAPIPVTPRLIVEQ